MIEDSKLLFNIPSFKNYFVSSFFAAFASGMFFILMSWYIYNFTDSAFATGLFFIAYTIPGLFLSSYVSAYLEKFDNKTVCQYSDFCRALLMLVVCAYFVFDVDFIYALYAFSFLMAVFDNAFMPSIGALIRRIVKKDNVGRANIFGSVASQVGAVSGAGVCGLAIAYFGPIYTLVFMSFLFFTSGVLIYFITVEKEEAAQAEKSQDRGIKYIFDVFRFLKDKNFFKLLIAQQVVAYLVVYSCNTLLPKFVVEDIKGSIVDFGVIDAFWGCGAVIGGMLLGVLYKKFSAKLIGFTALFIFGVLLLSLSSSSSLYVACINYGLLGAFGVMIRVNSDSELLKSVDPEFYTRLKSTIIMLVSWVSLGAYCLIGYFGDYYSAGLIFKFIAFIVLAIFGLSLVYHYFCEVKEEREIFNEH